MNYDALCFGLAVVIGILFLLAAIGMTSPPHRTAGRTPNEHKPGWKNRKGKVKR